MTIKFYDNPFRIAISKDIAKNEIVCLSIEQLNGKYRLTVLYIDGEIVVNDFDQLWEALDSLTGIVKTLTKVDISGGTLHGKENPEGSIQ